jgi:hypothetical protein
MLSANKTAWLDSQELKPSSLPAVLCYPLPPPKDSVTAAFMKLDTSSDTQERETKIGTADSNSDQ